MAEIAADALVKRLLDLSAKAKVERFLSAAKVLSSAKRNAFRTKGTREEILHAAGRAVTAGATTVDDLARLVDEVEENGAQHIFLFDLTPQGKRRVTRNKLLNHFPSAPSRPTMSLYSDLPTSRRTFARDDGDAVVVKEVFAGEYWDRQRQARVSAEERSFVQQLIRRRAINLLKVNAAAGEVEIRVDRLTDRFDESIARKLASEFFRSASTSS